MDSTASDELVEQHDGVRTVTAPRWKRVLQTCESTLSVVFAFAVGFVLVVAGGWISSLAWEAGDQWPVFVWLPACVGEGAFLWWLKVALDRGERPFIPAFVRTQPRWPILLRPVVAAWWVAHLALAVGAYVLLQRISIELRGERASVVLKLLWCELGVLTVAHTSQLYFLLAATAIWNRRRLVDVLWRLRFLIDLAAVIGGVLFYR